METIWHPTAWASARELSPEVRIALALAVAAVTVVAALVIGWLAARWARARAAGRDERQVTRLRRGPVLLLIAIGGYVAVEMAPLPPRLEQAISGTLFVVGALVAARLLLHLSVLLLTSSLSRVSGSERERLEREYVPLASKITTFAIGLIFAVVVAKHFGQDVTSLVAALGVGSLAIGLAAQQTLGNMIAGFTLLVDRPFRPGDRIRLATSETGEVVEIGVRSTRILLPDRNLLIVPNTELANSRVVNFAYPSRIARGVVEVTVVYGSDVARASAILAEAAASDPRVLKDPPPLVRVARLGPLGIELAVGFDVEDQGAVATAEESARRRVLERFAAQAIEIATAVAKPDAPSTG